MTRRGVWVGLLLLAGSCFSAVAQQRTDTAQKLPLLYWSQSVDTAAALQKAGISQMAVPADNAAVWRQAGFSVTALSQAELERREKVPVPRVVGRGNVASATTRPWLDANGWRFVRKPTGQFRYELPAGRAALALAEASAYGADAVVAFEKADLAAAGKMLAFLRTVPARQLPVIADLGVVDDGTPLVGEVLNLLSRRNLLFKLGSAPVAQYRVNIKLGTKQYPKAEAADPSEFVQKIRKQLGDENRSLRVYGSETVLCRLTGGNGGVRLHLINYGGRDIEGFRVRLRGKFGPGKAYVYGIEDATLSEFAVLDGATEFSLARLGVYAVIDLPQAQ